MAQLIGNGARNNYIDFFILQEWHSCHDNHESIQISQQYYSTSPSSFCGGVVKCNTTQHPTRWVVKTGLYPVNDQLHLQNMYLTATSFIMIHELVKRCLTKNTPLILPILSVIKNILKPINITWLRIYYEKSLKRIK